MISAFRLLPVADEPEENQTGRWATGGTNQLMEEGGGRGGHVIIL